MAIYGIGSYYEGTTDVSAQFISRGAACVGWDQEAAPALHALLRHVKTGDILYIKSFPPGRKLTVKAIGIVKEDEIRSVPNLGQGIPVKWLWKGPPQSWLLTKEERYNVRANTLYEEYSQEIQPRILKLLFSVIQTR